MIRSKTKSPAPAKIPAADGAAAAALEIRPCGMLVQKRIDGGGGAAASPPPPTVRVKVKYGAACHEIYLSSQSTFGELKKRLSERTGLHPNDQKLVFKGKERDSCLYLDTTGVKEGSKMALLEDLDARAKRLLEARRLAVVEKTAKSISSVRIEVDRLAGKVSAMEAVASKGGKVAEMDVTNLIELLMVELIKLDGIIADGDAKIQRGMQVRRVQKYVETLDRIKIKNSIPKRNGEVIHSAKKQPAVVVNKWETFDSLFSPATSASTTATSSAAATPRFDWELF